MCCGQSGVCLACELGKLIPWQVYEPGDVTEDQLGEHLGTLMFQTLHKEVWVEDDQLWCRVLRVHYTAHGPSGVGGERVETNSLVVIV